MPAGISFDQACLARLATISMQGVRLAKVTLGEHVAVFGQGLIGQFARQLAALDGRQQDYLGVVIVWDERSE